MRERLAFLVLNRTLNFITLIMVVVQIIRRFGETTQIYDPKKGLHLQFYPKDVFLFLSQVYDPKT